MGNALVDMMTELEDDSLLEDLAIPKGSMQLVDKEFSAKVHEKVKKLKRREKSGGSAANTICGIASMGVESAFIGKIGNDPLGEVFKNDMERYGIQPFLKYSTNETGLSQVLVSPDSERTFATFLGAAVEMEPSDISIDMFREYSHFYVEGYLVQHHELIRHAMESAKEAGLEVIIDLASFNVVEDNREFLRFLVKEYADVVFANAEEARAYTGYKDPERALEAIAQDCWIAVVKTGEKGSLIRNGKKVYKVDAVPVNSIDTTGAGDLYASGFLYGMLNGLSLPLCGEIGSLLAGKVIEVIGAKIPDTAWPEIQEQVKQIIYKQPNS